MLFALFTGPVAAQVRVSPVTSTRGLQPLAFTPGGRVRTTGEGATYQWPGAHFEAAFRGPTVVFRVGSAPQTLHVTVDGERAATLTDSPPGAYRIEGLASGAHRIRIDVVSEHQAAPALFGGFLVPKRAVLPPPAAPRRQIEFIGDSHSVGYGVGLPRRECSGDEVRTSTDNSLAFGPLTARRFGADYQVNAISGRGVVRNYAGMAAPTLPQAWPLDLFEGGRPYDDPDWRPQVIVIDLGTNDFSTALATDERWTSREALRADYQATYVRFVQTLRARQPQAAFVLMAPPGADDEIGRAVAAVGAQLAAEGESRVTVLPLAPLELTACDWHPSIRDQQTMAAALTAVLEAQPDIWGGAGAR